MTTLPSLRRGLPDRRQAGLAADRKTLDSRAAQLDARERAVAQREQQQATREGKALREIVDERLGRGRALLVDDGDYEALTANDPKATAAFIVHSMRVAQGLVVPSLPRDPVARLVVLAGMEARGEIAAKSPKQQSAAVKTTAAMIIEADAIRRGELN